MRLLKTLWEIIIHPWDFFYGKIFSNWARYTTILLVMQTRAGERNGLERAAAVAEAVRMRARPIYMSTLTSIFGMLPLMLVPGVGSQIYRGLATVIVGGMTVSAIFTLILMPSVLRLPPLRLSRFARAGTIKEVTADA